MKEFTISEKTTHQDLRITSDSVNSYGSMAGLVWVIHIIALIAVNIAVLPREYSWRSPDFGFVFSPSGTISVIISLFVISIFIGIYRSVALAAKYQIAIYNETVIEKLN